MNGESGFLGYAREGRVLQGDLAWLLHALEWVATVVDLAAIAILLLGALRFVLGFVLA